MLDPDSLKIVVLEAQHAWAIILLSLASVTLQVTLVWHVKSSAPRTFDPHHHVLYHYATIHGNHNNNAINNGNANGNHHHHHNEDDFMLAADLQARLIRTKRQWTSRLDDFSRRLAAADPDASSTFSVLLQLFAYEDVVESGKLDACDTTSILFYVPQLLSFLLHGAYDKTPQLEQWLLQKCKDNVYLSHRCVWFLRAWCLEASPTIILTPSSSAGSLKSVTSGFKSASSVTSLYGLDDTNNAKNDAGRYSSHERDSVKGLLFRVMECGQTDIAPMIIPCALNLPDIEQQQQRDDANPTDVFMSTPNILDALMTMADSLFLIQRDRRTDELRYQLQVIDQEFLPSNAIYMPVHREHHWTCRIVPEESIAISTKERVPCIVCLEVVEYTSNKKKKRTLLDTFRMDSIDVESSPGIIPLMDDSERDIVHLWRTLARNPYRHSSLLDKVTNFTQDSLKRFRDKNPKDALFWAESGIMEIMKPLTQATSLTRTTALEEPLTTIAAAAPHTPTGNTDMGQWCSPVASPTQQPCSSAMGQWGSPVSSFVSRRKQARMEEDEAMEALATLRNNNERRDSHGGPPPLDRKARPPPVVFKESWATKQERIRATSEYGSQPNWRLLPILIKSNDDLRQEQLASQLIYRMASILAKDRIPVWLCPYEIVALSNRGGIIEAIPDTISIASLKKNDPTYTSLAQFFLDHFDEGEDREDAKANFVESLAAYSIVCFILQIKDRHNGNILLDTCGHLIHIDFGFFFLSSPGKNSGFESAPFKLTRDFVDVMDGPSSLKFRTFRELCCRTFLSLRKHCLEITLLVEMVSAGNEELACFRGRPDDAVQGLRERFRLDLNDRACQEYVNALIDESLENWRTRWYDRYQRFCVGVL